MAGRSFFTDMMQHHQVLPSEEVFVVDDEPAICELFAALFTLEGYQVTSFAEGDSFLAAARERIPAFVLLISTCLAAPASMCSRNSTQPAIPRRFL
jgi:PleD family two-component response regulator